MSNDALHLKKRLQLRVSKSPTKSVHTDLEVVHLPSDDREQHDCLQNGPPLHAIIRGLCRVPMPSFPNYYVFLLVFDSK